MARQGQFGRAATGASNLSDAIRSLVQQQNAQEESILLNAFYAGTEYKGTIPTMTDIISFYDNAASLAGIEKGTVQWTGIQQKISEANNFDISKTYKDLSNIFESTNGSNYTELMTFLKGRAMQSTDPNHLDTYASAISTYTKNFVSYQSDNLQNGLIGVNGYRNLIDEIVASLDPTDPNRAIILNTSYAQQFSVMDRKQRDKVAIGILSTSQYSAWAKNFANSMLAAGISKNNTTYLDAMASSAGAAGGSPNPRSVKLNKTTNSLSDVWSLIKGQVGAGSEIFYPGMQQTTANTLDEMAKHPEWVSQYVNALNADPSLLPDWLAKRASGNTPEDIQAYIGDLLDTGVKISTALEASGTKADAVKWTTADQNAGNNTAWGVIKNVDSLWVAQRAAAKDDGALVTYLDGEYAKYLNGEQSHFGKLPEAMIAPNGAIYLTDQQHALVKNQFDALNGGFDPGKQYVTTAGQDQSTQKSLISEHLSTINTARDIGVGLQNGTLVNVWDPSGRASDGTKGVFKPQAATSAGIDEHQYQYTYTQKLDDGTFISEVRIAVAIPVVKTDRTSAADNNISSVYLPETGKTIFVDKSGQEYDSSAFVSNGIDGYMIAAGGSLTVLQKAPRFIYTDNSKGISVTGPLSNADLNSNLITANDLRAAADSAIAITKIGMLNEDARKTALGDNQDGSSGQIYDALNGAANKLEVDSIVASGVASTDFEKRARIAELTGDQQYAVFLRDRATNNTYTEKSPNYWVPTKKDTPTPPGGIQNALGELQVWGQQNPLAAPLTALASIPLGIGAGIENLFTPQTLQAVDKRSESVKAAERATNIADWTKKSITNSSYPVSQGDTFFRNLNANKPAPYAPSANTYMGMQATAPVAPTAVAAPVSRIVPMANLGLSQLIATNAMVKKTVVVPPATVVKTDNRMVAK